MSLKIKLDNKVGPQLKVSLGKKSKLIKEAVAQTAELISQQVLEECRADIASAGNFGSRWTDGLTVDVTQGGGNMVINVRQAVPYWRVFEFGATIEGKPMLWIPLSWTDAVGVRARDYGQPLFRVDRKVGAPLLLSGSGKEAEPKYFGKESVKIPQKFHLRTIIKNIARTMRDVYRQVRAGQGA